MDVTERELLSIQDVAHYYTATNIYDNINIDYQRSVGKGKNGWYQFDSIFKFVWDRKNEVVRAVPIDVSDVDDYWDKSWVSKKTKNPKRRRSVKVFTEFWYDTRYHGQFKILKNGIQNYIDNDRLTFKNRLFSYFPKPRDLVSALMTYNDFGNMFAEYVYAQAGFWDDEQNCINKVDDYTAGKVMINFKMLQIVLLMNLMEYTYPEDYGNGQVFNLYTKILSIFKSQDVLATRPIGLIYEGTVSNMDVVIVEDLNRSQVDATQDSITDKVGTRYLVFLRDMEFRNMEEGIYITPSIESMLAEIGEQVLASDEIKYKIKGHRHTIYWDKIIHCKTLYFYLQPIDEMVGAKILNVKFPISTLDADFIVDYLDLLRRLIYQRVKHESGKQLVIEMKNVKRYGPNIPYHKFVENGTPTGFDVIKVDIYSGYATLLSCNIVPDIVIAFLYKKGIISQSNTGENLNNENLWIWILHLSSMMILSSPLGLFYGLNNFTISPPIAKELYSSSYYNECLFVYKKKLPQFSDWKEHHNLEDFRFDYVSRLTALETNDPETDPFRLLILRRRPEELRFIVDRFIYTLGGRFDMYEEPLGEKEVKYLTRENPTYRGIDTIPEKSEDEILTIKLESYTGNGSSIIALDINVDSKDKAGNIDTAPTLDLSKEEYDKAQEERRANLENSDKLNPILTISK